MKKVLIYLLIIAIGSTGVYYGLTKYNQDDKSSKETSKANKVVDTTDDNNNNNTVSEVVPSRDGFVSEAIKLQTLAENQNGNDPCRCYNVKDLDRNTSLTGSILVFTNDDLFISNMWLSNGYYMLNGTDTVATELLEESKEEASIYCGEANAETKSSLCATNY